jgi:hypothetical protein
MGGGMVEILTCVGKIEKSAPKFLCLRQKIFSA